MNVIVFYIVCLSCFILYAIGSTLAVHFFVSNLSKMVSTMNGIASDVEQQKLSNLSTKYMLLFAFAIISTILLTVWSLCVNLEVRPGVIAFDMCINLWCIYLQFAFAEKQYNRYCGWFHKQCRNCGLKRNNGKMKLSQFDHIKIKRSKDDYDNIQINTCTEKEVHNGVHV